MDNDNLDTAPRPAADTSTARVSPAVELLGSISSLWPRLPYASLGVLNAWLFLLIDYGAWRSNIDEDGLVVSFGSSWFFGAALCLLVLCSLAPRLVGRALDSRACSALVVALSFAGTACLILVGPLMLPEVIPASVRDVLFPLGYGLCGIVSVTLTLQCARAYCRLQPSTALFCALFSELVVFAIFCIVIAYSGQRIVAQGAPVSGAAALAVLPIVAWGLLKLPGASSKGVASIHRTTHRPLVLWRLFAVLLVFCAITAIVRNCFLAAQVTLDYQSDARLTMLVRIAIALALMLGCLAMAKRLPLEKFYLFASTGIVTTLALVFLIGWESPFLRAISNSLFFMLDILIWCLLVLIVRRRNEDAVTVFGLGEAIVCAGMLIGYALGANGDIAQLITANKFFGAVLIVVISACVTIVFNERHFEELLHDVKGNDLSFARLTRQNAPSPASPNVAPTDKARRWETACRIVGERAALSEREQEILRQLADNRTPKDMAEYLGISLSTVRTHTRNVYAKLSVHSRDELIALVREEHRNLS